MRDMHRRHEIVTQQMIRDHREFRQKLDEGSEQSQLIDRESIRKTDKILARLDEASEESKAHREALLALVDRLPPPNTA